MLSVLSQNNNKYKRWEEVMGKDIGCCVGNPRRTGRAAGRSVTEGKRTMETRTSTAVWVAERCDQSLYQF